MPLLTLIILVILPAYPNARPGAMSEAARQEACVFIYAVEKKQKPVMSFELKDELF